MYYMLSLNLFKSCQDWNKFSSSLIKYPGMFLVLPHFVLRNLESIVEDTKPNSFLLQAFLRYSYKPKLRFVCDL